MRQLRYNSAGANLTRQALGGAARARLSQPSSTPSGTILTSWHVVQYLCLTSFWT